MQTCVTLLFDTEKKSLLMQNGKKRNCRLKQKSKRKILLTLKKNYPDRSR